MTARQSIASSFVTEVLATAGKLEKDDLVTKLSKLSKRIRDGQIEVYEALQKKYGEFDVSLNTTIYLSTKAKNMLAEMEGVASKINNEIRSQLTTSTKEFKELSMQLEESNEVFNVLEKLVKIHENLLESKIVQKKNDYVKAAKLLNVIQEELSRPINEKEDEIKILVVLKQEYDRQRETLVQDLAEIWSQKVKWTLSDDSNQENGVHCTLCFPSDIATQTLLGSILGAMQVMSVLDTYVAQFGSKFMKYILKPLISDKHFAVSTEEMAGVISVHLTKSSLEPSESRTPSQLFVEVNVFLDFLNKHLLGIIIQDEENQNPLMYYLGRHFSHEFITLIINECLANAIPSTTSELKDYKSIITATQDFQKVLAKVKFVRSSDQRLSNYVGNINELYAEKKTKEVFIKARKLMTSDMHNIVKVSTEEPFGDLRALSGSGHGEESPQAVALNHYVKLSDATYQLPSCYISEWTQQLIHMAYEMLHESTTNCNEDGVVHGLILYSVRAMFDLFCQVVPTYHKENLAALPQLSAIHHNNCMFIAHHLLTMGHQFRNSLPNSLHPTAVATFVDMVPRIRRIGTQALLEQMRIQRDQMLEYLKGAQGFQNVSESENGKSAERAIKQCLYQLQHLHKVWKDVLPKTIYCKTIGTLLNAVILTIINSILSLEDISVENADMLHSLMSTVKDKAPSLFDIGDNTFKLASVLSSTPKWVKFNELMMVLDAGLAGIADRWADGKGPLAEAFSTSEVKLLIRALFQNTEKRAAVLARIR